MLAVKTGQSSTCPVSSNCTYVRIEGYYLALTYSTWQMACGSMKHTLTVFSVREKKSLMPMQSEEQHMPCPYTSCVCTLSKCCVHISGPAPKSSVDLGGGLQPLQIQSPSQLWQQWTSERSSSAQQAGRPDRACLLRVYMADLLRRRARCTATAELLLGNFSLRETRRVRRQRCCMACVLSTMKSPRTTGAYGESEFKCCDLLWVLEKS